MLTMAVGHSDDVDAAAAIAIAIDQCRARLNGRTPQAGFLVAAFGTFEASLVAAVREAFPGVALMGSTSSAEMSSTSGFLEDSVTLALFGGGGGRATVADPGRYPQRTRRRRRHRDQQVRVRPVG
jgi:hypothetical protein